MRKQLGTFIAAISIGILISVVLYYFVKRWYSDYITMLKHADGEWRNNDVRNDYSDETTDAKMKYFWLFDW